MDLKLNDKTALVTGSTAGIGLEIARKLAAEGASVVLTGRSRAKLDRAAASIAAEPGIGSVRGVLADAATAEGAEILAREVPRVDVLVNNLGIYESKPFAEIADADWHKLFDTNVVGGARLAQRYFQPMLDRNWGRIIFRVE
jgi:NAD(P)-dependent dehydrogenase (short-subunit alcohol dehydrogenase family)